MIAATTPRHIERNGDSLFLGFSGRDFRADVRGDSGAAFAFTEGHRNGYGVYAYRKALAKPLIPASLRGS